MSGRGTERLLRVARTIADLEHATNVMPEHLDEAARFRSHVSQLWQRIAV
jgi:predicted ATPase with chaperone activity